MPSSPLSPYNITRDEEDALVPGFLVLEWCSCRGILTHISTLNHSGRTSIIVVIVVIQNENCSRTCTLGPFDPEGPLNPSGPGGPYTNNKRIKINIDTRDNPRDF